jgi:hypothetical protein
MGNQWQIDGLWVLFVWNLMWFKKKKSKYEFTRNSLLYFYLVLLQRFISLSLQREIRMEFENGLS